VNLRQGDIPSVIGTESNAETVGCKSIGSPAGIAVCTKSGSPKLIGTAARGARSGPRTAKTRWGPLENGERARQLVTKTPQNAHYFYVI